MLLLMLWIMAGSPVDAGASVQVQTQTQAQDGGAEAVPCKTVDDCWLDDNGHAIHRPKRYRGRALPRGDCDARIQWLRHKLSCEENVCVAKFVGDAC
jgi:hypothetical protein